MPQQFRCRFCQQSYQEVLQFLDHFETHMNQEEQKQNKHQSSTCKEIEDQIQNEGAKRPKFIDQVTNTRLEDEEIILPIYEKDSDSLKNSSQNERLAIHCEKCDKPFSTKGNLKLHIKTVHDKVKCHTCDLCLRAFGLKGVLQRHVKTVHDKVKPHKCDLCLKAFGQKCDLQKHIKTVHEEVKSYKCDLKPYICKICDKRFGNVVHFKIHVKTVHKRIKDFDCKACDKSFGEKGTLKRHVKAIHENGKTLKCESCENRFYLGFPVRIIPIRTIRIF